MRSGIITTKWVTSLYSAKQNEHRKTSDFHDASQPSPAYTSWTLGDAPFPD